MAGWLAEWNNLAPILGILVSLLGFSVAVMQIRRTTNAVDAAKLAVDAAREAIIRNQLLTTITRLIERTQEIRSLYANEQWDLAYFRYNDVWVMLSNVRSQHPNLGETQSGTIEELVVQLQDIERSLERAVRSRRTPTKVQEHIKALQRLQALSGDLLNNLQ